MKKLLYSRTSGKTISLRYYKLFSHFFVGIPLLLILIHCCVAREDILIFSLGIIMVVLTISICILVTNRIFFSFDETALLVINAMGYVKYRIEFVDITSLLVVGAADEYTAPGGSKALGCVDKNDRFVYLPYLLIYKSHIPVVYNGDDVRSYIGQEYGFVISDANLKLFYYILNVTKCPIYFNQRIIQDDRNLYESCQRECPKGRVRTITHQTSNPFSE